MSLVKDRQGRTDKLNYLFTYLSIFLPLCDIIIYYNFYPNNPYWCYIITNLYTNLKQNQLLWCWFTLI
jgi:hypothetical protein